MLLNNDNKTNMSSIHTELIPLQLFEEDTGVMYQLQLSPDLHSRAVNDIIFAQRLLNEYKQRQTNEHLPVLPLLSEESFVEKKMDKEFHYEDPENEADDSEENQSKNKKQNGAYKWNEQESKLLLTLYKESQEKYDNGSLTKKKFYTSIMNKMKEKGYTVTMQQCITKMDTFKRLYRKVKDHNAESGNEPKSCEYYDLLDEMFHKKPWIKPLSAARSNIPIDMDETGDSKFEKRRSLNNETEQTKYFKQCLEEKRLKREAHTRYMEEKLTILRDIANKLHKKNE